MKRDRRGTSKLQGEVFRADVLFQRVPFPLPCPPRKRRDGGSPSLVPRDTEEPLPHGDGPVAGGGKQVTTQLFNPLIPRGVCYCSTVYLAPADVDIWPGGGLGELRQVTSSAGRPALRLGPLCEGRWVGGLEDGQNAQGQLVNVV